MQVRSPGVNTDFFDIVAGVLQGHTLVQYLFIICLDNVLRTSIGLMINNGFKLTKERSRRYPTQTITDTDYADDIVLLANPPAQAETISRLKGGLLKLADEFYYLGSSVLSTEKYIQHASKKDIDNYRLAIGHMEIRANR